MYTYFHPFFIKLYDCVFHIVFSCFLFICRKDRLMNPYRVVITLMYCNLILQCHHSSILNNLPILTNTHITSIIGKHQNTFDNGAPHSVPPIMPKIESTPTPNKTPQIIFFTFTPPFSLLFCNLIHKKNTLLHRLSQESYKEQTYPPMLIFCRMHH